MFRTDFESIEQAETYGRRWARVSWTFLALAMVAFVSAFGGSSSLGVVLWFIGLLLALMFVFLGGISTGAWRWITGYRAGTLEAHQGVIRLISEANTIRNKIDSYNLGAAPPELVDELADKVFDLAISVGIAGVSGTRRKREQS